MPAGRPSPPPEPDWAKREPHQPEPVWLDNVSNVSKTRASQSPLLLPAAVVTTVSGASRPSDASPASVGQQQQPQQQPQQQSRRPSAVEQPQHQQHWQQEQLQCQQQRHWQEQQRRLSQRQQQQQQPPSPSASQLQQESHQQWQPLVMPKIAPMFRGLEVRSNGGMLLLPFERLLCPTGVLQT